LVAEAHDFGLRARLATNGTLITPGVAASLKSAGLDYAAISLATVGPANDRLRGKKGAFNAAMAGFKNCLQAGLDAGLRLTLAQRNGDDLDAVFSLLECENVPQVCFHHLAYAGRGNDPLRDALSHSETRRIMGLILRRSEDFYRRGSRTEILTQDNYADGAYLCQKLAKKAPADAARVYALLKRSGGGARGSGVGIGNIDAEGNVHPDQYWSHYTLGNIAERPFSQIWSDLSDPLLAGLQDRLPRLKGRCANCRWQAVCGGNLRVRADQVYGDPWMPDPACYLSNEEISRERPNSADSLEDNVLLEKQAA
jgi:radical SAM protein with 4Fe4S-binding SPASM domain